MSYDIVNMKGQEKRDLLIQVITWTDLTVLLSGHQRPLHNNQKLLLHVLCCSPRPRNWIKHLHQDSMVVTNTTEQFFRAIILRQEQVIFQFRDDVYFILDQHDQLNFYSDTHISLKQQNVGTHVTPRHIISIPSQPVKTDIT